MSPEILRLLALISVFAAVALSVEAIVSYLRANRQHGRAINARLQMISRGIDRDEIFSLLRRETVDRSERLPFGLRELDFKLRQTVHAAGIKIPSKMLLGYLAVLIGTLFIVVAIISYSSGYQLSPSRLVMIGTFSIAAGWGLPMLFLSRKANNRKKKLSAQFPVALDVFVRGLRAGHPIASALELLTEEMTDPIGTEFGIVVDEITYGADIRDALQNMADRCGLDDMQMFVVSLSVQSETGGNLAEILENLSGVIRERASMMMKVRALSSEGRMTGLMLTVLPIFAFVSLFLLNPTFYLEVADDPAFLPSFGLLLLMFLIGVFWIRRLVDLKV